MSGIAQAESVVHLSDLRSTLATALPQNSETTRLRYSDSLIKWFFRDGLNGFALSVWKKYRDIPLQTAIHRYLYLAVEPIMAVCIAAVLPKLQEGIIVPSAYLIGNTEKLIGHELVDFEQETLAVQSQKAGIS